MTPVVGTGKRKMSSKHSTLAAVRKRAKLFEANTTERRKSILFTMAIATGFLGITATSAVLTSVQHLPTVAVLSVLSALAFVFAGFLFAGRLDWLAADDELLWRLFDS
jgi:cytochrome c biogenesis protein CcdA